MPENVLEWVLGSHNAKKLREMQSLLSGCPIQVRSLAEFDQAITVDETGTTFQENARLKAIEQARHLQKWVLAEDSGLSVTALGNRPGVFSARYAGEHCDDDDNNAKLIEELATTPDEQRGAFYTCQLCLADPAGNVIFETTGQCHGRIARELKGQHGFGYDPLFIIREYHRTFGELGAATKSAISHRARAMSNLRAAIPRILSNVSLK